VKAGFHRGQIILPKNPPRFFVIVIFYVKFGGEIPSQMNFGTTIEVMKIIINLEV